MVFRTHFINSISHFEHFRGSEAVGENRILQTRRGNRGPQVSLHSAIQISIPKKHGDHFVLTDCTTMGWLDSRKVIDVASCAILC